MNNERLISIITAGNGNGNNTEYLPQITYHSLGGDQGYEIPEVAHFYFVPLISEQGQIIPRPNHPAISAKTINRAFIRVDELRKFLVSEGICPGTSTLCEVTGSGNNPNVTVFPEISINGHSTYMLFRGVDQLRGTINDYSAVNIKSGPCLFSNRAIRLELAGASENPVLIDPRTVITTPIQDICVDKKITPSEFDGVTRLSGMIANVVQTLPKTLPVTVNVDVPRVQYYYYLIGAFRQGLISQNLLLRWFDEVDRRRSLIIRLMHYKIRRNLPGGARLAAINVTTTLDVLEPHIREAIAAGRVPQIQELVNILRTSNDPIWSLIMNSGINITAFEDLRSLSYAVEEVRGGLWGSNDRPTLGIAVENHPERKIFDTAQDIIKSVKKSHPELNFSIIGLYPLERVLTGRKEGRPNLYHNDPGHKLVNESGESVNTILAIQAIYRPVSNNQ